jgi:hypothetical protein
LTETETAPAPERVELQLIHQSCKDCVFAQYTPTSPPRQFGCAIGRLQKYREQGTTIVEAYDEECEFDIVNGRNCPAFRSRNGDWAKKIRPEDRPAQVREELRVRLDAIVVLSDAPGLDEPGLTATFDALRAQTLPLSSVTVVNNQGAIPTGRVVALVTRLAGGLPWHVLDMFERDADGNRPDRGRCVDLAVPKLTGHFYTMLRPGDRLAPTFAECLDHAVVDDMARFVYLYPATNGVGETVALGFHRAPMVNGNTVSIGPDGDPTESMVLRTVAEKAGYVAISQKAPYLVAGSWDVCPAVEGL